MDARIALKKLNTPAMTSFKIRMILAFSSLLQLALWEDYPMSSHLTNRNINYVSTNAERRSEHPYLFTAICYF